MAQVVDTSNQAPRSWEHTGNIALGVGALALIGLVLGSFFHLMGGSAQMFYQAWMYGWIFWMAVTVGCFGLMLLQNIVRASWGFPIIRLLEAGAKMLPYMFVLFLPILFNVFMNSQSLYPWADYNLVQHDDKMLHRYLYMNPTFWAARTLVYFALWSGICYVITKLSSDQDRTRDGGIIQQRVNIASVSFVLLVLTGTFAYVDWVMSLDPHWYSTIYGFWFLNGSALTAMSFIVILTTTMRLRNIEPYASSITPKVTRDFGLLLITFTMVWAYFSVSQFIITWSGNLPEEITYYLARNNGTTAWITSFLVTFMFFVPFVCLLSGRTKRVPTLLRAVAIQIFVVRFVEAFWNIAPFYPRNYHTELVNLLDFSYLWAVIGIGGLWMFGFFTLVRRNTLVPVEELTVLAGGRYLSMRPDSHGSPGYDPIPDTGKLYETRDVALSAILKWIAFLFAFVIGTAFVTWIIYKVFVPQGEEASHFPLPHVRQLPSGPRLQANPVQDIKDYRAMETNALDTYGRDPKTGAIHIPVDRAMDLVVPDLPTRPGAGTVDIATTTAPNTPSHFDGQVPGRPASPAGMNGGKAGQPGANSEQSTTPTPNAPGTTTPVIPGGTNATSGGEPYGGPTGPVMRPSEGQQ